MAAGRSRSRGHFDATFASTEGTSELRVDFTLTPDLDGGNFGATETFNRLAGHENLPLPDGEVPLKEAGAPISDDDTRVVVTDNAAEPLVLALPPDPIAQEGPPQCPAAIVGALHRRSCHR